jgi:hypothetical protein
MTQYEPSPYTALSIYMFAVSHHAKIAVNVIDYPGMLNVEESKPGRFRIRSPKERDDLGRFVPDVAVCTYHQTTELWHVKFPNGELLIVRNDHGEFTVVGDEK